MTSLRLVAIIAATLMLIYPGIMFPQSFAQSTSNQTANQGTPNLDPITGQSCNAGGTSTTGYFLNMSGIAGESGDIHHPCQIDITSFSWGASNAGTGHGTGGGGGAGKVSFQDIHFTKRVDSSSPILFLDMATGKHIKTAVFTVRKSAQSQDFLTITFSDVLVSEYQMGGTAGQDIVPVDQFTLNFAKITVEYKPTKPDGAIGASIISCFDLARNAKC